MRLVDDSRRVPQRRSTKRRRRSSHRCLSSPSRLSSNPKKVAAFCLKYLKKKERKEKKSIKKMNRLMGHSERELSFDSFLPSFRFLPFSISLLCCAKTNQYSRPTGLGWCDSQSCCCCCTAASAEKSFSLSFSYGNPLESTSTNIEGGGGGDSISSSSSSFFHYFLILRRGRRVESSPVSNQALVSVSVCDLFVWARE